MTIIKSPMLAEVEVSYKSKVKAADRTKVDGSAPAAKYARLAWDENTIEYREEFMMLLLNRSNDILGWVKLASGGVSGVVVDQKVIFSIALTANASGIILVHNHPSGNKAPSQADMVMTKHIISAGNILDIKVLDHLILTADSYYSFTDNGLI